MVPILKGQRLRNTCDHCRKIHKKCDDLPSCSNCNIEGIQCRRGLIFKLYEEEVGFPGYSENQTWLFSPTDPQFVNETSRTADYYTVLNAAPIPVYPVLNPNPAWSSITSAFQNASDSISAQPGDGGILPRLPEMGLSNSELAGLARPVNDEDNYDRRDAVNLMPLLDVPNWPLDDPSEQELFENFVKNLAIWLDLCDPVEHFQKDVPGRAPNSQILLNAIFALSARHLNLTRQYDPLASNRYHNKCLASLRYMMSDAGTFQNASLFAALIILRVLEEMEMPVMASQVHLSGIKHFVDARDHHSLALDGDLSEACFWVGLRQEIYSAVTNHKPIQLKLDHPVVDRSISAAPDHTWANRAVILCADVINCCFTDFEVPRETWENLTKYAGQWRRAISLSSQPIIHKPPRPNEGESFAEIKFTHGSHVIGHQHHLLGCILLAIFNPAIPRFGPGRKVAVRQMERDVIAILRDLCGIGVHNSATPPALFTASMGISICGDMFHDRADQEALLDVLALTEQRHARPTTAIQNALKQDWGWNT